MKLKKEITGINGGLITGTFTIGYFINKTKLRVIHMKTNKQVDISMPSYGRMQIHIVASDDYLVICAPGKICSIPLWNKEEPCWMRTDFRDDDFRDEAESDKSPPPDTNSHILAFTSFIDENGHGNLVFAIVYLRSLDKVVVHSHIIFQSLQLSSEFYISIENLNGLIFKHLDIRCIKISPNGRYMGVNCIDRKSDNALVLFFKRHGRNISRGMILHDRSKWHEYWLAYNLVQILNDGTFIFMHYDQSAATFFQTMQIHFNDLVSNDDMEEETFDTLHLEKLKMISYDRQLHDIKNYCGLNCKNIYDSGKCIVFHGSNLIEFTICTPFKEIITCYYDREQHYYTKKNLQKKGDVANKELSRIIHTKSMMIVSLKKSSTVQIYMKPHIYPPWEVQRLFYIAYMKEQDSYKKCPASFLYRDIVRLILSFCISDDGIPWNLQTKK